MSYIKIKDKYKDIDFNYDGVELCPVCGKETGFVFNPVKDRSIVCEHCKDHIQPCSLCDCNMVGCGGDSSCLNNIRYVLMEYAKEDNEV